MFHINDKCESIRKFNFILSSQLMVIFRLIHIHKHEF